MVILPASIPVRSEVDGPGLCALPRKITSHLDDVVGNHPQPDPASHAVKTGVEAATQPVSSFERADATLTTGSPFLPPTKPTLPLKKFSVGTLCFLVGHRHPLHPECLPQSLAFARIKPRIGSHCAWDSSQSLLVHLDRG